MATPQCDALNSYFVTESGRFTDDIGERGRMKSWWASLGGNGIPSEPFPDEMGWTLSNVIYERAGRTGGGWRAMSEPGEGGDATPCLPEAGIVGSANTVRTGGLYDQLLYTNFLCIDNIRHAYNFRQQVAAIQDNFKDQIIDEWEIMNREQYVTLGQNKVIFNSSLPNNKNGTTMTSFPAQEPTSPITQKYLDYLRFDLQRNAAALDGGAYAMEDGQPVFAVIMSGEQQENLFQSGGSIYQSSRINQDLRYTKDADKLLKPYGVTRTYHGWFHIIDNKAPRYNFVNGAWVQVPFYVDAPATNGTQLILNPDYLNADYELVIVFLKTVISRMVPPRISSAGRDATFQPWDYSGAVEWINKYDRTCNPLGTMGYWAARLMAGYMPKKIENGWSIMVKRCQGDLEMSTCTSGS